MTNALKVAAIGAEVAVISSLAVSSSRLAFAGHETDWLAAAPLATVVALESLRLPLAFRLPRMRFTGAVCGVAMLAGLSVTTGEAASLAFENLIDQRTAVVTEGVFRPMMREWSAGRLILDPNAEYVTAPYFGDETFCNEIPASEHLFKCLALHKGRTVDLATTRRTKGTRS